MQITKGYKSTEFYVTIISFVVGALVTTGTVAPTHADDLINAISQLIGGLITLVPVIVYIYNRTWLKSKALNAPAAPVTPTPTA